MTGVQTCALPISALTVKNHKKKKQKKEPTETPKTAAQQDPQPSPELMSLIASVKDKLKPSSGNSDNTSGTGKASDGDGFGKGHGGSTGIGDKPDGIGTGNKGYFLKNRKLLQRPQLLDNSQEEGTVVVEIIVDETGKVIEATPGQRGSTTTSAYLYTLARQASKTLKFNASSEGIHEQKGTSTFVFRLH